MLSLLELQAGQGGGKPPSSTKSWTNLPQTEVGIISQDHLLQTNRSYVIWRAFIINFDHPRHRFWVIVHHLRELKAKQHRPTSLFVRHAQPHRRHGGHASVVMMVEGIRSSPIWMRDLFDIKVLCTPAPTNVSSDASNVTSPSADATWTKFWIAAKHAQTHAPAIHRAHKPSPTSSSQRQIQHRGYWCGTSCNQPTYFVIFCSFGANPAVRCIFCF